MTDSFLIINARVPHVQGVQQIWIQDGAIRALHPCEGTAASEASRAGFTKLQRIAISDLPVLDVAGDWVSLGGIDLQINGALGLAFPDLNSSNVDQLNAICQFLWNQGVDGFLPTVVTTSIDKIHRALATIRSAKLQEIASYSQPASSSQILGVHLEGPFLNPQKRGAHPEEYLLPLTVEQVQRVLGDYASVVKVMTLAPELDPTGDAIAYLRSLGIIVSLGHSQATAAQAQQAFAGGASMVTHAFNAMPSLHHREPGLLGTAISASTVQCGFIADGQHVSKIMLDVFLRASRYDEGAFLVSDALAPLGLPDGRYPWDSREIEVTQGTTRLLDGTLSGTTLSLFQGVQNLVRWKICDVETAIALATTAPRPAIGLSSSYLHQPAHLIRWVIDSKTDTLSWQRITPELITSQCF